MSYDRDEWRRPWRSGEVSWPAHALPTDTSDDLADPTPASTSPTSTTTSTPASTGESAGESAGESDAGDLDDTSPWRRPQSTVGTFPSPASGTPTQPITRFTPPGPAGSTQPTARLTPPGSGVHAEPTQSITRFPQPPPSGWGERSTGPGSPAGSVRPPDATRTVDAPAVRQRRRTSPLVLLVVATLGGLIGAGAFAGITALVTDPAPDETPDSGGIAAPSGEDTTPSDDPAPPAEIDRLADAGVVPRVAEAVTPSVVRIDVSADVLNPQAMGATGLGSGVIYRSDGYVLTNHHVVNGASDVTVRLASGDVLQAEIIGSDELNDLAVLRVDGEDLPAITFRPEDEPLIVGEMVVAIGSPFGLDASVTTGVISALNREIRLDEQDDSGAVLTIPSVVQTDAAINPGNSGGALVDSLGRLVGVNTAILTRSGASQGVGFAVSAEQALVSAEQLIEQGFVRHPLLGISGVDVTVDVAEQFGLAASRGAVVESVQEGSGAAVADIRPGDIIVEVDGEALATMGELVAEVRRREPGATMTLGVVRGGQELDVEVELGERPR